MKTLKLLLITLLFIFLCFSCQYGVNINVENKSDYQIDSIVLTTDFQKMKLNNFDRRKFHNFYVDFKNSEHKGDGIFIIQVYKNDKSIIETFGYYSNGVPPSKDFKINIYEDKINVFRTE